MTEAQKIIADMHRQHRTRPQRRAHPRRRGFLLNMTGCTGCDWLTESLNAAAEDEHAAHVAAEIDAALGGLERQEQWVPVDANGHRWAPRQKPTALAALELYRAGGPLDFDDTVPLTDVEHESRWTSGWKVQP